MVTESYAHVHHIVSNVRGTLRADAIAGRRAARVVPGRHDHRVPEGPLHADHRRRSKARDAAPTPARSGWLGTDGDADFNILIRTLTMRGDHIELRAGAGIVADSIPERELEETRAKARGLLRAFETHMSDALGTLDRWTSRRSTVPADDRGLQYGDGLFETILVRAGSARFLEAHLARLDARLRAARNRFRRPARRCARKSRAARSAGAAARHSQDHRHARQRAAARLRAARNESRRGAC